MNTVIRYFLIKEWCPFEDIADQHSRYYNNRTVQEIDVERYYDFIKEFPKGYQVMGNNEVLSVNRSIVLL